MKRKIKPKGIFKSVRQKNLVRKLCKIHLKILKTINYFKQEEYD